MAQIRRERSRGISIELRVLGRARDGNIGKTAIYQLGVDGGVDVYQHAVSRESLRAVTGDGIAMIEVPHLFGVERNRFAVIHADGELPILDPFHSGEIAVGDA